MSYPTKTEQTRCSGAFRPRCNYCRDFATHWFQYRGFLASTGRAPRKEPLITVAACDRHFMCPNYASVLESKTRQLVNQFNAVPGVAK